MKTVQRVSGVAIAPTFASAFTALRVINKLGIVTALRDGRYEKRFRRVCRARLRMYRLFIALFTLKIIHRETTVEIHALTANGELRASYLANAIMGVTVIQ